MSPLLLRSVLKIKENVFIIINIATIIIIIVNDILIKIIFIIKAIIIIIGSYIIIIQIGLNNHDWEGAKHRIQSQLHSHDPTQHCCW